jgi:hypothetical protein
MIYNFIPLSFCPMASTIFYEKDSDTIYEEMQLASQDDYDENEYREDRYEQMASRYGGY